jgi:hypothetical protein
MDGEGTPAGELAAADQLIYGSRRVMESEEIGTNKVVEKIWVSSEPGLVTNVVVAPDGTARTNVTPVATLGEWQTVTNEYPVLRWWARHVLDVVDFGGDPASPVLRPPVSIPGALQGLSHSGAMIYTLGDRSTDPADPSLALATWLEASAYDGVEARLIDSVALANQDKGETVVVAASDALVYAARGGWSGDIQQRLEVWAIGDDGRWSQGTTVPLSTYPGELRVFNDLLLARNGGYLDLFDRRLAERPALLPVDPIPGCYGGELQRGDGSHAEGLWLPLGDYGAVHVGP